MLVILSVGDLLDHSPDKELNILAASGLHLLPPSSSQMMMWLLPENPPEQDMKCISIIFEYLKYRRREIIDVKPLMFCVELIGEIKGCLLLWTTEVSIFCICYGDKHLLRHQVWCSLLPSDAGEQGCCPWCWTSFLSFWCLSVCTAEHPHSGGATGAEHVETEPIWGGFMSLFWL